MTYKRFVEVGRVALICYGPETGKLCTIINVLVPAASLPCAAQSVAPLPLPRCARARTRTRPSAPRRANRPLRVPPPTAALPLSLSGP